MKKLLWLIVALAIPIACFSDVAVADGSEESDPDALIEAALRNFDVLTNEAVLRPSRFRLRLQRHR